MLEKSKIKLLLRDGLFSTVLSLFTCYLLSLLFFNTSFFSPLGKALKDFSFLDVYYAERLDQKQTIDTDVILINIEHKTRKELAVVLQKVLNARPKVIGFDVILKEFEKTAADTLLARLLNDKNVVSTYNIQPDSLKINNHPFFIKDGMLGFANFNFDTKNSVVREFNGIYNRNENLETSFTVELAKKYLSEEVWKANKIESKIVKARVINYNGGLDRYLNFTVDEIVKLEDLSLLRNKVVILGYLGFSTGNQFDIEDKHFTPLNKITAGKSVPDMYGAVIHANILSMLISDNFMYKVPRFWALVLMFLFSFIASTYFIWLDTRLKISYRTVRKAIVFVFSVLLVWITLLLFKNGIILKSAPIIAVAVFSAGFMKYYKHLVLYINTKRNFNSYLK